jgi:hypothetical protein
MIPPLFSLPDPSAGVAGHPGTTLKCTRHYPRTDCSCSTSLEGSAQTCDANSLSLQRVVFHHRIERYTGGVFRKFEPPATLGATKPPKCDSSIHTSLRLMDASTATLQRAPACYEGTKRATSPSAPPSSARTASLEHKPGTHPRGADDSRKNGQSVLLRILDGL